MAAASLCRRLRRRGGSLNNMVGAMRKHWDHQRERADRESLMALILAPSLPRSLGAHPTFDKSIAVAPSFRRSISAPSLRFLYSLCLPILY